MNCATRRRQKMEPNLNIVSKLSHASLSETAMRQGALGLSPTAPARAATEPRSLYSVSSLSLKYFPIGSETETTRSLNRKMSPTSTQKMDVRPFRRERFSLRPPWLKESFNGKNPLRVGPSDSGQSLNSENWGHNATFQITHQPKALYSRTQKRKNQRRAGAGWVHRRVLNVSCIVKNK
jgi:hypothetical protein